MIPCFGIKANRGNIVWIVACHYGLGGNIANNTLSLEVAYPEVTHITTTYIFLAKADHCYAYFQECREIYFYHVFEEKQAEKINSLLTSIAFLQLVYHSVFLCSQKLSVVQIQYPVISENFENFLFFSAVILVNDCTSISEKIRNNFVAVAALWGHFSQGNYNICLFKCFWLCKQTQD